MPKQLTDTEIKAKIGTMFPDAKHVVISPHGMHNVTVIADDVVVRFAQTEHALHTQEYEVAVLKALAGKTTLHIPNIIDVQLPEYITVHKAPGEHLSEEDLLAQPPDMLKQFTEQIAQFMVEINEALSASSVTDMRKKSGIDENSPDASWSNYFDLYLKRLRIPAKPWLEKLASEVYNEWLEMQQNSKLPVIAVHDDLHMANLLFENGQLSSVLDFSELTAGTAAQELRQLFRLDENVIRMAIAAYHRKTGVQIPFDEVRNWAITYELATYCRRIAAGTPEHPSAVWAAKNLRKWLPQYSKKF